MSIPAYIATRAEIEADAATENDPNDDRWLSSYPNAEFFGVDGEIQAAFATREAADKWLAELQEGAPCAP